MRAFILNAFCLNTEARRLLQLRLCWGSRPEFRAFVGERVCEALGQHLVSLARFLVSSYVVAFGTRRCNMCLFVCLAFLYSLEFVRVGSGRTALASSLETRPGNWTHQLSGVNYAARRLV